MNFDFLNRRANTSGEAAQSLPVDREAPAERCLSFESGKKRSGYSRALFEL
jgi:hypothetical protein